MKAIQVNDDEVYAKMIALWIIYTKDESCWQEFLGRITYHPQEMTAVINGISDPDFRSWVEASIPAMKCRKAGC